jgi:hypothetical protein
MKTMKIVEYGAVMILLLMVVFLMFRKPAQIFPAKTFKQYKRELTTKKQDVSGRTSRIEDIRNEVTYYKTIFDTVNIVRYQDSLIRIQDTQIVRLTEITKIQDTVITQLEFDRKRFRRQRNVAVVAAVVATTIAILK